MPAFSIQIEKDIGANIYMEQSNKRLQDGISIDKYKGFKLYNGKIMKLPKPFNDRETYIIDMTPVIPKLYNIFILLFFAKHLYNPFHFTWIDTALLILYSMGFFWTRYFLFTMIYIGIRKAGYKGKIKILGDGETIRRLTDCI